MKNKSSFSSKLKCQLTTVFYFAFFSRSLILSVYIFDSLQCLAPFNHLPFNIRKNIKLNLNKIKLIQTSTHPKATYFLSIQGEGSKVT